MYSGRSRYVILKSNLEATPVLRRVQKRDIAVERIDREAHDIHALPEDDEFSESV